MGIFRTITVKKMDAMWQVAEVADLAAAKDKTIEIMRGYSNIGC